MGVDLIEVQDQALKDDRRVDLIVGDIREARTQNEITKKLNMNQADVLLSDMSPSFSGTLEIDHLEA